MSPLNWDRAYLAATRASARINWEFLGGVVLFGASWLGIVLAFSLWAA
jgi:hypothetical protein